MVFGMVDANGGTPEMPFAFPFKAAAALFFCSAARAFLDFVPFAYNRNELLVSDRDEEVLKFRGEEKSS